MRKSILSLALGFAVLPMAGCVSDGYYGVGWKSYPYDGWYDGYYGPLYDGYWGTDGYFWYRQDRSDRSYRRGSHEHFRQGQTPPGGNFRRFEGNIRPPERGMRAPRLPREGGAGDRSSREGRHRP